MSDIRHWAVSGEPPFWGHSVCQGRHGMEVTAYVKCPAGHAQELALGRIDRDGVVRGELACVSVDCGWKVSEPRLLGWRR